MRGINWHTSSPFTKLAVIAVVNNRARFVRSDAAPAAAPAGATGSTGAMASGSTAIEMEPLWPGSRGSAMEEQQFLGDATDGGLLRYVDR